MQDLSDRTKSFAVRIVKLFSSLPRTVEAEVIGKQFLSSGTSVGAHYREAVRARSSADFQVRESQIAGSVLIIS